MNDNSTPHVEIYTDGGCEPNPGPGGYGAVLLHPRKRAEVSGGFRLTTNNRMEIFAAIAGLAHQLENAGGFQQRREALADDGMILGQQDGGCF